MIRIIDSHAHLSTEDFDKDRDQVIKRAFDSGVEKILCPTEVSDSKILSTTYSLIEKYSHITAAGGVHPHNAIRYNQNLENKIRDMAEENKIVAVGEIGLDFYYNYSPPAEQKNAFQQQLALARELKLPVIIHSRQAASDVFALIKGQDFTNGGIMHCFTENFDFAKKMMDRGFYISFSGILTYPKAHDLRETAKQIPGDRLLVETDSPFLTPVPFRKKFKRNEPAFVTETTKFLAGLKKVPLESFAEKMCQNFSSLFMKSPR